MLFAFAAGQRGADLRGDIRIAHDLQIVPAFGAGVEPQHAAGRGVGQLHLPFGVDDHDPFGHAAEDRFHAGAVGRELVGATADLADRAVERARHRPDLVVRRSRAPAARSRRRRSGRRRPQWRGPGR